MAYKYNGWDDLPTLQSKEILANLMDAKQDIRALRIIAETGLGKSNTIRLFKKAKPKHTYTITIGYSYSLNFLLDEMMRLLGCYKYHGRNSKHLRFRAIIDAVKAITEAGKDIPLFIFDEGENSTYSMLKSYKEIYDNTISHCSLVLIGTPDLVNMMDIRRRTGQSIPQLTRRFKAGTRFISGFDKARDMKPFFDKYIPGLHDLQDLLISLCDNYGELRDYLDPFLTHCSRTGKEPNVTLFRLYHKIPVPKTKSR